MESIYLRTLVEIVKSGGISKAAEVLCVTQPAVSRRFKFLDEQYGYPLLERGNSLRPTEAGRFVIEKAEKLLAIENELLAGLLSICGKMKISFCCTPAFGICHLPKILRDFVLHYTNQVDLKFVFETPENIVKGLNEGSVDLAVIEHCDCFDLTDYVVQCLPDDCVIFLSSPDSGISTPVTQLEQLLDKILVTSNHGCCSRIMLEKNLKLLGRDLREFKKIIAFDDLQIAVKIVRDGEGISFLSRDLVSDCLAGNALLEHRLAGFDHVRKRSLVFSNKCARNACLEHFAETVYSHFNPPPIYPDFSLSLPTGRALRCSPPP